MRLGERSAGELMVLAIAATVCSAVLISLISTVVIELVEPDADTSQAVSVISDTINTLIGLLAGFVAGRTDAATSARPDA